PDIVQTVYFTLPFLTKFLLIPHHAGNLEVLVDFIRGHTEMVDDDGLWIVDDAQPTLTKAKSEIPILAISGRETDVEAAKFLERFGLDEQTRARTVHHFTSVVIAGPIGIVEETDEPGRAITIDQCARFLEAPIRKHHLRANSADRLELVKSLKKRLKP